MRKELYLKISSVVILVLSINLLYGQDVIRLNKGSGEVRFDGAPNEAFWQTAHRFNLTSNLTIDLTVNTDFAQVEADDEMVNLTRYSLFYPEKRMFFQERSSIYNFSLGGPGQLFYSRKIGIDDDGVPVPILGGARLTGRVGKWDMGFMSRYGTKGMLVRMQHGWLPEADSKLFSYSASVFMHKSYRVSDNGLESAMYGPGIHFVTKSGWTGRIGIYYSVQGVDESFELTDNLIYSVLHLSSGIQHPAPRTWLLSFQFIS